ncbi:THAP domain-containing protein 1 [Triplophysa rosa]|uniref:THAP domain-containing protein 1 n=1 Tax=Triplophysa rosa TaxID=992332 RepID=A0A9W7X317_TRIRA|nr:THAP domain-containing protein 1 [Triplophysa rosa]KAI7812686.1 putative THAP domain-containing protein 1-like [Triplophysa rosa]
MMVQSCSAHGCTNRYSRDKNISFHKFPLARPDVCHKWVGAMKRRNFKPTKYSSICSQHFTRDSFRQECNNRVLKDDAVPSLFAVSKLHVQQQQQQQSRSLGEDAILNLHPGPYISSDHNYTVEDAAQQKRRITQLESQLEKLRRNLKTVQQKCRRQERQLERFRAATSDFQKSGKHWEKTASSYPKRCMTS